MALSPTQQKLLNHTLMTSHPQAWQTLAASMHVKSYQKEQAVFHHGDPATALWLVISGWVKLTRQTPNGKETIIGFCTKGELFGEAALFPHANYPYHAEIIGSDAELAAIPAETIRQLVEKNTPLSASILQIFNERVAQTRLQLEHLSTLSAAQRLGCFLLRLCHNQSGEKTLQIPVEKNILASYLGMKPETLSRSQQQLKPLGIHVSGHTIRIEQIAKLREFVCSSCSESGDCEAEHETLATK